MFNNPTYRTIPTTTMRELAEQSLTRNEDFDSLIDQVGDHLALETVITVDNYNDEADALITVLMDDLGLEMGEDFENPSDLEFFEPVLLLLDDLRPRFFLNRHQLASHVYANYNNGRRWNPDRGISTLASWVQARMEGVALVRVVSFVKIN